MYELFNLHWKDGKLSGIHWSAMPRQIPQAIALTFVVAFGSSLDVAAIQQDMPNPLDYNSELVTVGQRYKSVSSRCCVAPPRHNGYYQLVSSPCVYRCKQMVRG